MTAVVKEKIQHVETAGFVHENLASYGRKTVEDRAVPDFRDGLKPVHRRALWAAHKMGLTQLTKSAKLVGETLGNYHPHSDQSIYGAVVSMVNWPSPVFIGQGNFGNLIDDDPPASMRYTELKLNEFAKKIILDPEYIECVPMHANYDGTAIQPLYLPALLPMILMTADQGIAVGVSVKYPSFSAKSIAKLVTRGLRGQKITPKLCAKMLELESVYGGAPQFSETEYADMFSTSKPRVEFAPTWKLDAAKRTLTVTSSCPGLEHLLPSAMEKLAMDPNVQSMQNRSGDTVEYVVTFKASVNHADVVTLTDKLVKKFLNRGVTYSIAGTERSIDDPNSDEPPAEFFFASIVELLDRWIKWRIALEKDMLTRRIDKLRAQLHRTKIMMLAAESFVALSKEISRKSDKPLNARIAKLLSVTVEDADMILSMQLRSLANLEYQALQKKKSEIIAAIKDNKAKRAIPHESAAVATQSLAQVL